MTSNLDFNKSKTNTFIETESFVIKRNKKFYIITSHNFLPIKKNIELNKSQLNICINSKWNELLVLCDSNINSNDKENDKSNYEKYFSKISSKLPQIGSYAIINGKNVLIKKYCFFNFGFLPNYPKTIYIKIKIQDSTNYLSGSPLYDNSNRLLGMVSFSDERYIYCLPSYYILKTFEKENKILLPEINYQINKINRNIASKGLIYNPYLGIKIPLYTYLLLESNRPCEITFLKGDVEETIIDPDYNEYRDPKLIKNSRRLEFVNNYVLLSSSSFHSLKLSYPDKGLELLKIIESSKNISTMRFMIENDNLIVKN
tara:strand:+ start:111 stop:1055 length:945 start_codon:yes stop_codon:yes gene_type:complete